MKHSKLVLGVATTVLAVAAFAANKIARHSSVKGFYTTATTHRYTVNAGACWTTSGQTGKCAVTTGSGLSRHTHTLLSTDNSKKLIPNNG